MRKEAPEKFPHFVQLMFDNQDSESLCCNDICNLCNALMMFSVLDWSSKYD